MASNQKLSDMEIAKMLMDERKRNIMIIAKDNPVTVSEIAEKLGEKPSRLYYHVNKLEEAGLLELVETRQQGNLIEKYYKSKPGVKRVELNPALFQHDDSMMTEIMKVLEPGLKLLAKELKENSGESDKQVDLSINFSHMTGREWKQSHNRMLHAMRDRGEENQLQMVNDDQQKQLSEEELEAKSKYAYFILSYRIDDAKDI
ncbi:helix-turn-helix domain-containing protein [Bacillus salitolerans]|uniref:Helix-turn-helix domain-containing protein n=1 Tax=Bacillus salitolerans TaxID=1437434 RepID=A0ABW4LUT7_9BACI